VARGGECDFGGAKLGRGAFGRGLVFAAPASLASFLECGARGMDAPFGSAHALLATREIDFGSSQRLTPIGRQLASEARTVCFIGGACLSERLDAERERVVSAYRAQHDVGPVMGECVVDLADAGEAPPVALVPHGACGDGMLMAGDIGERGLHGVVGADETPLCAGEGLIGTSDLVASAAPQSGEWTEPVPFSFPVGEPVAGASMFGIGARQLVAGPVELVGAIGWSAGDDRGMLVAFGAELTVEDPGVVVSGEGLGLPAMHRVGHDLSGGTPVGEKTGRMIRVGSGVPGVSRELAAALADVAAVAVERGRAEEMDLAPGAALGTVDGSRPRVRDIGRAVGAGTRHERSRHEHLAAVVEEGLCAGTADREHGSGGAVTESGAGGGFEVGVDEDAVTGRVGARFQTPAGSKECGSAQLSARYTDGADSIGEVFAVRVAHREHRDVFDPETIGIGDRRQRQLVAGLSDRAVFVFPPVSGADLLADLDVTTSEPFERDPFGLILLSAVLGQRRGGDPPGGGEPFKLADQSTSRD
jgi:hypothetical protein